MTDYRNYIPISLKSILFLKFEQSRPHIPSPFTCHLHQLQSSMSLKSSLLLLIRHEDLLLFYHLRLKSSWRRSYDNHHRWNQRGHSTCQAPRIALHQLRNLNDLDGRHLTLQLYFELFVCLIRHLRMKLWILYVFTLTLS